MPPTENPYHASDDAHPNDGAGNASSSPPVMVHVVAPATLPAGYTFEAQLAPNADDNFVDEEKSKSSSVSDAAKKALSDAGDDSINEPKSTLLDGSDKVRTFTVTVPEGGVTEGETFLAPLPEKVLTAGGYRRIDAPTGRWKDGLFGCFNYGLCHPSLWCSLCCTQIAMGQVMQRTRLTWLGYPAASPSTWTSARNTFKIVVALVIAYTVYSIALEIAALPPPDYDPEVDSYYYIPPVVPIMKISGSVIFTVWAIWALLKTRESVRATYSIPVNEKFLKCPGGEKGPCEDFVCATFCSCCVVAQMLRHTGEYERYEGRCCTSTGHPRGAPAVV